MKIRVLTFVRRYLPGYRSGGPVRTIANMVAQLGDDIAFKIVTSDRDYLDSSPYDGLTPNRWGRHFGADILYLSPERVRLGTFSHVLREVPHDVVYFNSFFDPRFTILPMLARRLMASGSPVIVAPRGEFASGALNLKATRKWTYLRAWPLLRPEGLVWQASSEAEAGDIYRVIGAGATVHIAEDLATRTTDLPVRVSRRVAAPLRVCFLSRITPMKNLLFAIRVLTKVRVPIEFNVYGPIRDEAYWRQCVEASSTLPSRVAFSYRGEVSPSEVLSIMAAHDVFFLPTLGENFGHVIAEALRVGTPVLISDRTSWRDLERHQVGWDISLEKTDRFVMALESLFSQSSQRWSEMRAAAMSFAQRRLNRPDVLDANRCLFAKAMIIPQGSR